MGDKTTKGKLHNLRWILKLLTELKCVVEYTIHIYEFVELLKMHKEANLLSQKKEAKYICEGTLSISENVLTVCQVLLDI